MKIQKLHLQNFRNFRNLELDFTDTNDLVVFVGGNASGKSSILEAICIALSPILTRLPLDKKAKPPSLSSGDLTLDPDGVAPFVKIAVTARTPDGEQIVSWDRTRLRDQSPKTKSEAGKKLELKQLYSFLDGIVDAHNSHGTYRLPVFAYYSTNRAVDVPQNRIQQRVLPKFFSRLAGLENATSSRTDFRYTLGWFNFLEQWEFREKRDEGTSSASSPVSTVRLAIERALPGISNPRIEKTGRFAVDFESDSGGKVTLSLDQLSDGYQVALGVIMDFAIRLALVREPGIPPEEVLNTDALMLIDEVDLHLHPSWQQRIIKNLRCAFPNTQIIATTHSPQLLTTVSFESIRVLEKTSDGWKAIRKDYEVKGLESSTALSAIMGVDPIPPVEEAGILSRYQQLIQLGQYNSEDGRALRLKLEDHFGKQHHTILECDRLIRLAEFKSKLPSKQ